NRVIHVQLQRPTTSRCFGGTSICAVPNFTLLTTISQHRLLEKEGRLTTAFAANVDIPLCRGMFPLSHCEFFWWAERSAVPEGSSLYVAVRGRALLFLYCAKM